MCRQGRQLERTEISVYIHIQIVHGNVSAAKTKVYCVGKADSQSVFGASEIVISLTRSVSFLRG